MPEGLAASILPKHHRRRLRTSDPIERTVQQKLKRRTARVRVFPSDHALLRPASAVLDETWACDGKHVLSLPMGLISNGIAGMADRALARFPDVRCAISEHDQTA